VFVGDLPSSQSVDFGRPNFKLSVSISHTRRAIRNSLTNPICTDTQHAAFLTVTEPFSLLWRTSQYSHGISPTPRTCLRRPLNGLPLAQTVCLSQGGPLEQIRRCLWHSASASAPPQGRMPVGRSKFISLEVCLLVNSTTHLTPSTRVTRVSARTEAKGSIVSLCGFELLQVAFMPCGLGSITSNTGHA
jgi:hypothetical protein